ncbi:MULTISPECIES: ferredoxin [Mesorhizobium]|uniref:ferredoxin n=1 Tax=Mesorhizobium TaxID=68287 RepID=UPI0030B903A3
MGVAVRIIVHKARCQGHARCWARAPAVFKLDEAGYILPGDIDIADGEQLLAADGVRSCPELASAGNRRSACCAPSSRGQAQTEDCAPGTPQRHGICDYGPSNIYRTTRP